MKVYTKRGDKGTTDLANGERVAKTDVRIEALGAVDELNSHLGLLLAELHQQFEAATRTEQRVLCDAQRRLFAIGAWLAQSPHVQQLPTTADTAALERLLDEFSVQPFGTFRGFVLPGGHPVAASAHIARSVCRRAEIAVLRSAPSAAHDNAEVTAYLNRLSDFLFTFALKINFISGFEENML